MLDAAAASLEEIVVDARVLVRVGERGADAERLQDLADQLRVELDALDVDDVSPVSGGVSPPGSRAADLATIGALLVSINGSAQILGQLLTTVRSWLGRNRTGTPRTVELTVGENSLRLTDASADQQERLIEEFVRAIARE